MSSAIDDYDEEALEGAAPHQFDLTPGFLAFVAVMLVPAVAALAIFIGAALVSGDVKSAAAEATAPGLYQQQPGFRVDSGHRGEVAGWKRALVGICPAH